MTDNLSNNPNKRIFAVDAPPKLIGNYERLPQVENQIKECLQLSEKDFAARLTITNRESEDFLREETLCCFLLLARAGNLPAIEDKIAERLLASCKKRIELVLRAYSFDANFIEEAVGEIYFQMLTQVIRRNEKSYDFWEVIFYNSLNRLINNYLRKHAADYRATKLFTELAAEDEENDYEGGLVNSDDFAKKQEKRLASREILAQMPKDLRQISILYYVDEETQEKIAEIFGVTDRTVRNQLKRIKTFLESRNDLRGDTE